MKKILSIACLMLFLTGCPAMHEEILGTSQSQAQIRNYQSKAFDTADKDKVLRGVISTMQDLGFIIDKADSTLGTVTGTSFTHNSKLTVSVREKGKKQTIVRANAQQGLSPITDPKPYQNFFNALSQSLFLDAHDVN
ncbi:MAG: hypothetical protein LBU87_02250 [Lactobacillales bacterium]|jgi:hypothetical protein|nr:hypothetical protein [Lactobacillales bacterium]